MFQSWFCQKCGFELCDLCHEEQPTLNTKPFTPCVGSHCKSWFSPVAVFTVEVLEDQISAMEAVLALPPPKGLDAQADIQPIIPEADRCMELHTQSMGKYKVGELTNDLFLEKWRNREPFVLTGITDPMKPEDLLDLERNKRKHCMTTFHDGQAWCTRRSTLGSYFKVWESVQLPNRSLQIRVYSILCPIFCAYISTGLPTPR